MAIPSTPSAITAPTSPLSQNQTYTFTVNPVPNTTVYIWSFTGGSGWSFASLATSTPSVSITLTPSATSGTVHVSAHNIDGTSAPLSVSYTVNASTSLTSTDSFLAEGVVQGFVLNSPPVGATSYVWSTTAASWSIQADANITSIPTVNVFVPHNPTDMSGSVSVTVYSGPNGTGTNLGTWTSSILNVIEVPNMNFTVSGPTTLTPNTIGIWTVSWIGTPPAGTVSYHWTAISGSAIAMTDYTTSTSTNNTIQANLGSQVIKIGVSVSNEAGWTGLVEQTGTTTIS